MKGIIAENLYLSAYCSKGHYNDMDMLEVGRSLTTEEDKTHFGMWCIMNSPLLIGCDLRNIKAETRLERTRYEAETGYISTYQEIKNNQAEKSGIYETADYCSCGYKAGWLGQSDANGLEWRNVYSNNGGEYNLTIAYICGENRNITISVNGEKVQTLSFNSGGWQKVGKKTLAIQLQPGQNTVRLSNATNWMPDIDYIDVVSTAPTGIREMDSGPLSTDGKTGVVYDLSGRKMTTPRNGINIINGHKAIF